LKRTAEFGLAAHRVFPAEIIAIERTRRRLGLSTPRVDHPLLATPLATPPPTVPPAYRDETVQAVMKKARAQWGKVPLLS
jgi:hypothetical protein